MAWTLFRHDIRASRVFCRLAMPEWVAVLDEVCILLLIWHVSSSSYDMRVFCRLAMPEWVAVLDGLEPYIEYMYTTRTLVCVRVCACVCVCVHI